MALAKVKITGTAPYMQNKFSSANRDKMLEAQKAGSAGKRTRKAKAPKDFEKVYEGSMHISQEGWHRHSGHGFAQCDDRSLPSD